MLEALLEELMAIREDEKSWVKGSGGSLAGSAKAAAVEKLRRKGKTMGAEAHPILQTQRSRLPRQGAVEKRKHKNPIACPGKQMRDANGHCRRPDFGEDPREYADLVSRHAHASGDPKQHQRAADYMYHAANSLKAQGFHKKADEMAKKGTEHQLKASPPKPPEERKQRAANATAVIPKK